jgi:hypothetical protein
MCGINVYLRFYIDNNHELSRMITVHPAERQTQELISADNRPSYDSPSRFPGALDDRTDSLTSTFQSPPLTFAQKLYASARKGFTKPLAASAASSSHNRVVAHGARNTDPMSSSEYTPAVIAQSQSSNPQSVHARPPRRLHTHHTIGALSGERRYRHSALVSGDVSQNTFRPLSLHALPSSSLTSGSSKRFAPNREKDLPPIPPISEGPVNHVSPPSPPANHVSVEEPPTDDVPVEVAPPHDATFARNNTMERRKRLITSHNVAQQSLDLIHSIRGGYRILELVTEQGSGGVGKRPSQASLLYLI